MLILGVFLSALISLISCTTLNTVSSHLSSMDMTRLQKVFTDGILSNDLQTMYYSILNTKLGSEVEKANFCNRLLKVYDDSKLNDFEKNFYLVGAHKEAGCTNKLGQHVIDKIATVFDKESTSAQEIYYSIFTYKTLGNKIPPSTVSKLSKNLQNILKKDDSLSSLGHAFYIAAELGDQAAFVADRVEDAIVQADEVDGKMLQFEGGLSITALIVNGAFKVAKSAGKPLPINDVQAVKLASYFLSRRSVQTAKGAHLLIEGLKTLSLERKIAPICIQIIGNGQLQSESPLLSIKAVDLLGKPLVPHLQSIFGKVVVKKGNTVIAEKVQFISKSSDKTTYLADLTAFKPSRGIYTVDISADTYSQTLNFKVLGKVKAHSMEIGIGDSDAASTIKKKTVSFPLILPEVPFADNTQRITLKAVLTDEGTNKVMTVHQAFVLFLNKKTEEEIIYVAEQDSSKAYKFDLDIGARGADFGYKSAVYQVEFIVGDASLSNSFKWHVVNVDIKFSQEPKVVKQQIRKPRPEIKHQFRQPEKRPPRLLSDIFTGLCLTPLVLLFIIWGKIGINVSNFTLNLSDIGFHMGFGSILALFAIFWLQLNMFQTIRWLIPIAIITFLCGNRLLRRISSQKSSLSH